MGILLNKGKNYIINGAMDYWQRLPSGTTNITTGQNYQSVDRFNIYYAGTVTGTPTTGKSTTVPTSDFIYSSAILGRRNAGTFQPVWYQRIESSVIKGLSNKNITVSYWVKPDIACTTNVILTSYASPDAGGVGTTIISQTPIATVAGVWQRLEFTYTLPDVSNGLGVYVTQIVPSGTDASPQGYLMTGLQLEEGVSASNFERSGGNIVNELDLCQRYFEKSYQVDVAPASVSSLGATILDNSKNDSTRGFTDVRFKSSKRVVPTVTLYNPTSGATGSGSEYSSATARAMTAQVPSMEAPFQWVTMAAAAQPVVVQWTADAEI